MIPDFNTYIKESVWGDIRRRAEGQSIRKEEEIDHLDQYEFGDYLKSIYNCVEYRDVIHIGDKDEDEDFISIQALEIHIGNNLYVELCNMNDNIEIHMTYVKKAPSLDKLIKQMKEVFGVQIEQDGFSSEVYVNIWNKDDPHHITNSFFVKVLDYILDNANKTWMRLLWRK